MTRAQDMTTPEIHAHNFLASFRVQSEHRITKDHHMDQQAITGTQLEQARKMAHQMLTAAYDAHGSLALCPPADVAFEFCAGVEYDEPGTYPFSRAYQPSSTGARCPSIRNESFASKCSLEANPHRSAQPPNRLR